VKKLLANLEVVRPCWTGADRLATCLCWFLFFFSKSKDDVQVWLLVIFWGANSASSKVENIHGMKCYDTILVGFFNGRGNKSKERVRIDPHWTLYIKIYRSISSWFLIVSSMGL